MASEAKGIRVPVSLYKTDTVAEVGKAAQVVFASLANAVTNEFALDRADYDVDVVVTIRKTESK